MKKSILLLLSFLALAVPSYAQDKGDAPKPPPLRIIVPAHAALSKKQLKDCRDEAYKLLVQTYYPISKVDALKVPDEDPQDLKELDEQIAKMARSLNDRYTEYTSLSSEMKDAVKFLLLGETGSGVGLRERDGKFIVEFVERGTPFYSHLRKGDMLSEIKGTAVKGKKATEVEKLLASKAGKIRVTGKDEAGKDFDVTVEKNEEREEEDAKSESAKFIGNTLYLHLRSFSDEDVEELMSAAVEKLDGKTKTVDAIVLDLRGNPGGLYRGALTLTSLFMKKGTLSIQQTRQGLHTVESKYSVDGFPKYFKDALTPEVLEALETLQTKPLYVLTNGFTASSAEICSGALQDNKRATVYGENTFGKHCGYDEFTLKNGGTLHVTSMLWLTPNGRSAEGKGLAPDKVVVQPRGSSEDVQLAAVLKAIKAASAKK